MERKNICKKERKEKEKVGTWHEKKEMQERRVGR